MDALVEKHTVEPESHQPLTVKDHYALNMYASIYCLCFYISRLSQVGGQNLEQNFQRYPFLKQYFDQSTSVMPDGLRWEEGTDWWAEKLSEMEDESRIQLPLAALQEGLNLSFASKMALILAGLVEEDSRFGTLFSDLQQPLAVRRPMLETLGNIVAGENIAQGQSPWDICYPLIQSGIMHAESTLVPRSEWVLKVNSVVWDLIRGNQRRDDDLTWVFHSNDDLLNMDALILDDDLRSKVAGVPELFRSKRINTLVLRAQEGSHSVDVFSAIASSLSKSLIVVDLTLVGAEGNAGPDKKVLPVNDSFGIVCTILNALPVFIVDLGPGETSMVPKLKGYDGPLGMILGEEGGLEGKHTDTIITLSLPLLNPSLRALLWRKYLALNSPQSSSNSQDLQPFREVEDVDRIATQFRLPGDYIRQVSEMAINNASLEKRCRIDLADIRLASRNLNRQKLDMLADPLDAKGSWAHLISVDSTAEKLDELQQRCCYREQLLNNLGPAFKNSSNCGVRALFTGRSGTGKTLAAKILAAEVGMDIYRVDLASIVNKYIGETEKNLHKVLTRAEALDVILLLDEGDALLGARTDVKSANDRYANLETNYLLQRLEHYQGVILITTNLSDNIDKAFQRRMDIVIPFFQPQLEQRLAIFILHLPDDHLVGSVYLERASNFCALMGGQIRNVCLHAALVALDEGSRVGDRHLDFALRSEYRKNGGTFPLDVNACLVESDGGMGSFVNALAHNR